MTCPHCGTQNPDRNRFCTHCGGKVVAGQVATAAREPVRPRPAVRAPAPGPRPAPPAAASSEGGVPAVLVDTGSAFTNLLTRLDWQTVAYFAVFVAALFTRFYDLGLKPLHHDESIHAYYAYKLFRLDGYLYDPTYHGPFLYHANALAYLMFGVSDATCRIVPALFGALLVALPFFFREWLGRTGALMCGLLLTFSPTVTYVSRFIRDDIYLQACSLFMLVCFFKWLRARKRWLIYAAAAALAVSFAAFEATYITMFIFGTFAFLWYLRDTRLPPGTSVWICAALAGIVTLCLAAVSWGKHDLKTDFWDAEAAVQFLLLAAGAFGLLFLIYRSTADKRNDFVAQVARFRADAKRNSEYLLYCGVLVLVVQIVVTALRVRAYGDPFGLALLYGFIPAVAVGLMLLAIAFYFEDVEVTFWSAVIFAAIYVPLYSTMFSNMKGLADGLTTSLTYWLQQHGVKRGNQPLNFYPFLTLVYELCPFLLSLLAMAYYAFRRNVLANALMWWLVLSVVIYSWAGEKMPWLLVHLAVPGILLSGYYMGRVVENLTAFRRWVILPVFALLCTYSVHAMVPVNFYRPADPIEPLVYTQSSDDIKKIVSQIERISYRVTGAKDIHMTICAEATWPFPWYLREYKNIGYPKETDLRAPAGQTLWADTPILLFQEDPQGEWRRIKALLGDRYDVKKYHHRVWWIVEFGKIIPGFQDIHSFRELRDNLARAGWYDVEWKKLWKYLMYREVWNPKGSVDLYFCVQKGLEHKFD